MTLTAFLELTLSALLGAAIGFERQWNQGMAGLRTNALVAFGAACFVGLHIEQAAAYIVTGIGFLGAGVIFREGGSVRGLNTAATLWCSAAVGALSGAGYFAQAIYGAIGAIAINLGLRHMQTAINRWRRHPVDVETDYMIEIDCGPEQEAAIRALLSGNTPHHLGLRSLHTRKPDGHGGIVHIAADFFAHARTDEVVEHLVGRIGREKGVFSARWSLSNHAIGASTRSD
jgi:putative Mg2+ transporter-C (MgtC) family protein